MVDDFVNAYMLLHDPFLEVVPLACFVVYIFFSFCDGFGLNPARKIVWAVYFLFFCFLTFAASDKFDLRLIISLSSLLAFILALFQQQENRKKGKIS